MAETDSKSCSIPLTCPLPSNITCYEECGCSQMGKLSCSMEPHVGNQRPSEGGIKHSFCKAKVPRAPWNHHTASMLSKILTWLRSSWCQQWPGPKPAHRSPEDRSHCPAQAWRFPACTERWRTSKETRTGLSD